MSAYAQCKVQGTFGKRWKSGGYRNGQGTLAEKPWDMVGRPRSSCASVWSLLLEGCCAKKSLSDPLGKPGSAPKLCNNHGHTSAAAFLLCCSVRTSSVSKRVHPHN